MPTIFKYKGYRFFFFANENVPLEPCHVHVRKDSSIAKFWVIPSIRLANSYGFNSVELNELEKIVVKNKSLIEEKWNEFFNIE
jgi:hypothetical protein